MRLKNTSIVTGMASCIVLGISNAASARDIESYEDYKQYCSSYAYQYKVQSPDCDRYQEIYQEQYNRELNIQQPTRRNLEQDEETNVGIDGYVGGTLGLFFPNDDLVNTDFGGSIYAGIKFNKYVATDLEISRFGGDVEGSDTISSLASDTYGLTTIFINSRFILPLENKSNSVSLYISPGIGISQLDSRFELADNLDLVFSDDTRFTWQIKSGVSIPVSRKLDIFGQLRYVDRAGDDKNAFNYFATEIGINFQF